jgi:hypothetical protein
VQTNVVALARFDHLVPESARGNQSLTFDAVGHRWLVDEDEVILESGGQLGLMHWSAAPLLGV